MQTTAQLSEKPVKRRVVKKAGAAGLAAAPRLLRDSLPTTELPAHFCSWVSDNRAAGISKAYAAKIEGHARRLTWFLSRERLARFDAAAFRAFLSYIRTAHELPEGRWGEKGETLASHQGKIGVAASVRYKPVKPSYVDDYYRCFCAFGNWAKSAGLLDVNPSETVKKPIVRAGVRDKRVFSLDEVHRLLAAAKRSTYKKRDYALCLFLLDTGIRASELCALTWGDLSPEMKHARIAHGKGDKARFIHWSPETARALHAWWLEYEFERTDPLFVSVGGNTSGTELTRYGLRKILVRLGKASNTLPCGPHAFRRTFATLFIAGGGQQMALMELMGHTDLKQTREYVQWAGADLATQARTYSPVASLKKARK